MVLRIFHVVLGLFLMCAAGYVLKQMPDISEYPWNAENLRWVQFFMGMTMGLGLGLILIGAIPYPDSHKEGKT
jgi:hypothetical protein